jgi:hypothetical protein
METATAFDPGEMGNLQSFHRAGGAGEGRKAREREKCSLAHSAFVGTRDAEKAKIGWTG